MSNAQEGNRIPNSYEEFVAQYGELDKKAWGAANAKDRIQNFGGHPGDKESHGSSRAAEGRAAMYDQAKEELAKKVPPEWVERYMKEYIEGKK